MSFNKEDKFLVLRKDDILKYLSEVYQGDLNLIVKDISKGREKDGKPPFNDYVVVNEDEPYAKAVWSLIEYYETFKQFQEDCEKVQAKIQADPELKRFWDNEYPWGRDNR